MQLDKEPRKWDRFLMVIWMCFNIVPCAVTWAQYDFFAALGWLSATMMTIAVIGSDVMIDGQRKIIQELDQLCRRLIKEREVND